MGAAVGGGKKGGPMADINVTPLIDVVLVLLVVFMVITPMLSSGLPVDLPMATETKTVNDAGQHIVISVTKDFELAIDQERIETEFDPDPVARKAQLAAVLVERINFLYRDKADEWASCESEDNCGSILVKADASLEYGRVREVLDVLGENRFTSVFIAVGKEK